MGILLANHADEYNKKIFIFLKEKLNLPIDCLITTNPLFFKDKKAYKETEIIDIYDFYYNEKILNLNQNTKKALSKQEVIAYKETESLFLKISDRLFFKPLSTHYLLTLYYELLLYWINYFELNITDLVVFSQAPHTGYDNIIYSVAKQKNIAVLITTPTLLNDRVLMSTDLYAREKIKKSFLKNKSLAEIKTLIEPEIVESISGTSTWFDIGKNINTKVLKNNSGNVVIRVILNLIGQLKNPKQFIKSLFLRSINSGFVFKNKYTKFEEIFISFLYYFTKKDLLNYYQSVSVTPDLDKKYVFFPLHYQPERTTMPEGEVFEDQFLAIKILRESIPNSWKIYVKDHPRQFSLNDVRTNNFRSKDYYNRLLNLENLELIDYTFDSHTLIEKSQFTATVQGSAGWESLQIGKATIIFANAWYSACESVFYCESVESCKLAILNIKKKKKRDVEYDLYRFAAYIQKKLITSAFYHVAATKSVKKYDDLIQNLCVYIKEFYESKVKKYI